MMNLFKKKNELDDGSTPNEPAPDTPDDLLGNSRWLKFFDLFKGFLTRVGVDYPQFRLIVGYKLYMDAIDPNFMSTLDNGRRRAGKNAFFRGLWVYALVSLFLIMFLSMAPSNAIMGLGTVMIFYTFMYMTVLVQAFSGSLLDVRDVGILETRGVSEKTRSAAQTAHILVYVLSLFIAMMTVPIVASFFFLGIAGGIVFLLSALVLMLVNYVVSIGLYAIVLHFFHGERLKNILSMIQIFIIVLSVFMYQMPSIMTQLAGRSGLANLNRPMPFAWYMGLVYPLWFTGPNAWLQNQQFNAGGILTILMLVAVVGSYFIYGPAMRRLTNNLSKLNESGEEPVHSGVFFRAMRHLVPQDKDQRTFFTLSWRMMQADGDYKMRVYPQMAMAFVMIIIFLVPSFNNYSGKQTNWLVTMRQNFVWSVAPLFATIGIVTAVYFLRFSKNPSAMKLFATIPAFDKSILHREAIRTVFVRLTAPLIILVGILTLIFLPPWKVLANILVGLGLGLLITVINGSLMKNTAPYSTVFQAGQVNTGVTFGGMMIAIAVAAAGGFAIVFLPWWLTLIAGVIILVGSWFLLNHSYSHVNFTLPGESDFE
ncbi:hypothetical protein EFT87_10215 [Schleiferilactobacillus harbinensis]|uniref:hypothetical protein n=1 Tax=Schleiferilactobacillus harbinensis TaxID=304207 RepID=UPI0021A6D5A4|nr:hypothetical protein [Schleiferilactobacillus harbinensis]MCT2909028.1 hypothetical protein [Schleiferilactobacillus harbinensis]